MSVAHEVVPERAMPRSPAWPGWLAVGLLVIVGLLLAACESGDMPPEGTCPDCAVAGVDLAGEYASIPFIGDIWTATWADNDRLYLAFGDATGMAKCLPTLLMDEPDEFDTAYLEVSPGLFTVADKDNEYCEVFGCEEPLPLCPYTPAGLVELRGPVPEFEDCPGPDQCVVSRHIPYGDLTAFEHSDKPSSLVFVNGRLYAAMHYPPGQVTSGYLAYSDDYGRTWNVAPGSPWKGNSPFKVLMFVNMGQAYRLNQDGYLYALGIRDELGSPPLRQPVYLARVRLEAPGAATDPVTDYSAYEYYAGQEGGSPRWSRRQEDAEPLEGLETMAQASAMYHEGVGRFLFLTGLLRGDGTGGLFEAPKPWGPWRLAATFPAGFIASLVPKGTGPASFYFTAAGGGGLTYNLNIGRMELALR